MAERGMASQVLYVPLLDHDLEALLKRIEDLPLRHVSLIRVLKCESYTQSDKYGRVPGREEDTRTMTEEQKVIRPRLEMWSGQAARQCLSGLLAEED